MSKESDSLTPQECVNAARELWLSATDGSDLEKVEDLYRQALRTNTAIKKKRRKSQECIIDDNSEDHEEYNLEECKTSERKDPTEKDQSKKKAKRKLDAICKKNETCLKSSECKKTFERLALLLCQSGRSKKAKTILTKLGYQCRLSRVILDYPQSMPSIKNQDEGRERNMSKIPCCILDKFITKAEIKHLRKVFGSPTASYWVDHNYAIEPPSPYFSYVLPLQQAPKLGFVGGLVQKIYQSKNLRKKFPKLKDATKVEMWAHNRPHPSGHQMHFDSDDEGRGGIRNPIISTILYITAGCGGPSLVTNQKLNDHQLATRGWMCHPENERLVAFDGQYLHGVIPGKGVQCGRRCTLMFAFWSDIRIREGDEPGSARPFPVDDGSCEWAGLLTREISFPSKGRKSDTCNEAEPIQIDRIYETLEGKKWAKSMGMPDYGVVFQGF